MRLGKSSFCGSPWRRSSDFQEQHGPGTDDGDRRDVFETKWQVASDDWRVKKIRDEVACLPTKTELQRT